MSSNNGTPSFTISMNEPNKEQDNSNPTPSDSQKPLEYILKKNESLDNENKDLRHEVMELKNRLDEEENTNDKNDSRLVHMKGLTKNLVEAKILCEKIKDNSVKVHSLYNDIKRETEKFNTNMTKTIFMNVFCILGFISIILFYESFTIFMTYNICLATNVYFFYNYFKKMTDEFNQRIQKFEKEIEGYKNFIKTKEEELKTIKNATDFLDDHIDGI